VDLSIVFHAAMQEKGHDELSVLFVPVR